MWLLQWLTDRWTSVYDWFGNSYWLIRGIVYSIPSYINIIYALINNTYNNALNAIQSKIYNFYVQYIKPAIDYVQRKIDEHGGILNWLVSIANGIGIAIENRAIRLWNDVVSWIKVNYDPLITNLSIKLTLFIADILTKVLLFTSFIQRVDKWITDVMSRISAIDIANLKQFYDTTKTNVFAFAGNPLGFILDMLWVNGISFFCYLLGYGLGATKYALPPRPNWNTQGSVVNISPIVSSGEIGNPVTKVYVSGYTFSSTHKGVDLGIAMGDTIYASHSGVVTFADWSTVGYGFTITLDSEKYWTRYAHLQSFLVQNGQSVQKGQAIALGDSTGNSTGAHLHFELKINGVFVDPLGYLQ